MNIQPLIGMQNPQPQVSGGLLAAPPAVQNPITSNMGPWSQLAYQMAGSPKQGGAWAPVAAPPTPVNTNVAGGGSGGSSVGGSIATGLLGAVMRNPQLLKSAYNGISGLLGGGAPAASVLAGGSPALSAVGTGAVAPAVDSAAADASAALGTDAAGSGAAATGGLLGAGTAAGSGAVGAAGASALGASGGFATGGAAGAEGGSAAGAGSLGALGTVAAVAAPFIAQQAWLGLMDDPKKDAGNAAMKAWMNATGAKFVDNPILTQGINRNLSAANTFGTTNAQLAAASNPGTWYDASGKKIDTKDVSGAIYQWALQNGVNPGDYHP